MDGKIRVERVKTIKHTFKQGKTGLLFTELTEEQRAVALVRMENHCFTISDQSRFTFEFEGNVLIRMIDHKIVMENMLD